MKRRGRPPLDDTDASVPLTVRITTRRFDALARRALQTKQSVPSLVRRALERDALRTLKSTAR